MKRNAALLRPALVALAPAVVIATPADAWAYVDPGTGSYLFQLAAAGCLAGIYTMRRYWSALVGVLRGRNAGARGAAHTTGPNAMD